MTEPEKPFAVREKVPIVAIVVVPSVFSGCAYRGLDGGRETGDDRAAPQSG
ncbi:hypothetical protein NKH48_20145 [Mesorhizobium sp. M1233]|uniref:hypothetical protein n=1 Tax=Mesorhizobium sp. M1233 TaxID=2957072 RepID=UPI00333CA370